MEEKSLYERLGGVFAIAAEFDEVAAELGRSLDAFQVPSREKYEVLAALAHKGVVTEGSRVAV